MFQCMADCVALSTGRASPAPVGEVGQAEGVRVVGQLGRQARKLARRHACRAGQLLPQSHASKHPPQLQP